MTKKRRNIRLDLVEFLSQEPSPIPKNTIILDNIVKAWSIINNKGYKNIVCSISGGSDSDVMLDIIHKVDIDKKVRYVWFDTGLEYGATKRHLEYLEKRYGIKIERESYKTNTNNLQRVWTAIFIQKCVKLFREITEKRF